MSVIESMTEPTDFMADTSTKASYGINALLVLAGGLTLTEWLAIGGFMLAVATFALNAYWQKRRFRLLEVQIEHEHQHRAAVLELQARNTPHDS